MGETSLARRDFIKQAGKTALSVSGVLAFGNIINGCATLSFKEEGPVIYPHVGRHDQKKIQPPENGCFIGFHPSYFNYYKRHMGVGPKILTPHIYTMRGGTFPKYNFFNISTNGTIPFLFRDIGYDIRDHGFNNLVGNKEFTKKINDYAKVLAKSGIPIFLSTMRELNGGWFPWGKQARTAKKVWKHMWQIFEDNGANEYATWVWEPICPYKSDIGYPDHYYPGDQYVDWIGLSVYSRDMSPESLKSFNSLVKPTYSDMRVNHPDKPVMMSEFGRTNGRDQAMWIQNAFITIKSWPGMKAAIFWDNAKPGDDHTLSIESIELYKKIMKDPYFIGTSKTKS